jgi:glucokinase
MNYAIGIDLGGTNIKTAAISADGELLEQLKCETNDDGTGTWAERIRIAIRMVEDRKQEPTTWIGIATPGLPAPSGRSIVSVSGRLQQLPGLDWTDFLGTGSRIPVINDAQAALLGEAWRGAAAGRRDVLMLTLGTGVGGAIMSKGRLMRGHLGRAGEVGHMSLQCYGPTDSLGIPGSLEAAIGNASVAARSKGRFTSTSDLVAAHRAGDAEASDVWTRSIYKLACAIASLINIVDPEIIVIGGGISAAGPDLFDPLERFLDSMEWRPYGGRIPIVRAALGDFAGAIGAARNAIHAAGSAANQ